MHIHVKNLLFLSGFKMDRYTLLPSPCTSLVRNEVLWNTIFQLFCFSLKIQIVLSQMVSAGLAETAESVECTWDRFSILSVLALCFTHFLNNVGQMLYTESGGITLHTSVFWFFKRLCSTSSLYFKEKRHTVFSHAWFFFFLFIFSG